MELRLKSSSGSWGCFPGVKAGQECVHNCGSWTPAGCETEHRLSFAFTSLNLMTSWAALFNRRVISQTHTRFKKKKKIPPSMLGRAVLFTVRAVCARQLLFMLRLKKKEEEKISWAEHMLVSVHLICMINRQLTHHWPKTRMIQHSGCHPTSIYHA